MARTRNTPGCDRFKPEFTPLKTRAKRPQKSPKINLSTMIAMASTASTCNRLQANLNPNVLPRQGKLNTPKFESPPCPPREPLSSAYPSRRATRSHSLNQLVSHQEPRNVREARQFNVSPDSKLCPCSKPASACGVFLERNCCPLHPCFDFILTQALWSRCGGPPMPEITDPNP